MASRRFYAYYIRGSQLALVEHDSVSGDGQTLGQPSLDDIGPSGGLQWKSPVATVADGLEIEYAYSPRYRLQSATQEGFDIHTFLGWGSNGQNLLLFKYGTDEFSLSSLFAVDDWIYISGSGRWSGLHQVKSQGSAEGVLTLKTKCNLQPSHITATGTFAINKTFNGNSVDTDGDIDVFKAAQAYRSTPYVFITDADNTATNSGLFSLTADTTAGQFTFNNKITLDYAGNYTSAAAANSADASDAISIYNAFYEQISVYDNVEVLEDESDTIDLPEYLSKALVYYVKAKVAEDQGDIEQKEYNMREFRRILEKHESSKIRGPRMMIPGGHGIR